jgi:hypothetical protein
LGHQFQAFLLVKIIKAKGTEDFNELLFLVERCAKGKF